MTKLLSVRRQARLTTILVLGVALTAANIAHAKSNHHHDHQNASNSVGPHFAISGQPANVKKVMRDRTKDKYAGKKEKFCEKIIVPTAECGVSSKNPVGNTHPSLPPPQTAGGNGNKGPSFTIATISNGTGTSVISNGKSLTVTSTSPGTITVTSTDHSSATLAGGYVTLRGATTPVQAGPGLAVHRLPNGDILVTNVPKGVTAGDTVKEIGKVAGNFGNSLAATNIVGGTAAAVLVGSAVAGTIAGHPIDYLKDAYKEVERDAAKVIDWVSGWF